MKQNGHKDRKKVALVIGAGSVKCAAALGLLRVLEREGIGLDMVVGCSGGALYAAAVALGMDTTQIASLIDRLWTAEITGKRNTRALLRALFPRRLGFDGRFGLKDDSLLGKRLHDAFGGATFADTGIPLSITATDALTGAQVVMTDGRLADAVRASMAIPMVFEPWPVDGRLLADGFLSDPLPVGVAVRERADVIIAMGFESPYEEAISSPTRFALQVSTIMTNALFRSRYAFHNLAHHSEMLLMVPQFQEPITMFDTAKIPAIIEAGEAAAAAQMPYLHRLLRGEVVPNADGFEVPDRKKARIYTSYTDFFSKS